MTVDLMHKPWEPQVEFASKNEIHELQLKRLKHILTYVNEKSPYYRRSFKTANIHPDRLEKLEDLSLFPFTTKDDLRNFSYPYGGDFLCVPREQVSLIHMTSGTTGNPVVGPYTARDRENWTNLMARTCAAAGITQADIVMNVYGYGLFTGGLGFHHGTQALGATTIPWGVGRTEGLVRALKDFKATVLTGTPSYQLYIMETARRMGMDPEIDFDLRITLPGAEIWDEGTKERIEKGFGLRNRGGGTRNIYGATEVYGPGAGVECEQEAGFHFWVDHFYLEIINPDTLEPAGPGEIGEMVVTTLTKEALPLIRYRLRDLTLLNTEPCECGRQAFPRCMWIRGRIDDVIHYKGAKVWPSTVQEAIFKFPEVQEFQIIVDRSLEGSSFVINIELSSNASPAVRTAMERELRKALFVKFELNFVAPHSLPRYEGKGKRVIIKQ